MRQNFFYLSLKISEEVNTQGLAVYRENSTLQTKITFLRSNFVFKICTSFKAAFTVKKKKIRVRIKTLSMWISIAIPFLVMKNRNKIEHWHAPIWDSVGTDSKMRTWVLAGYLGGVPRKLEK